MQRKDSHRDSENNNSCNWMCPHTDRTRPLTTEVQIEFETNNNQLITAAGRRRDAHTPDKKGEIGGEQITQNFCGSCLACDRCEGNRLLRLEKIIPVEEISALAVACK